MIFRYAFVACLLTVSHLVADTAFVTNFDTLIYSFNTNNVSSPATSFTVPPEADNIAFSPDGATVYFTTNTGGGTGGDVYSFPTNDPTMITQLHTGIENPMGIAISSDGSLGFVSQDSGAGLGLYSFPTAGPSHVAQLLSPITDVIGNPLFIAISGNNAFVGDIQAGTVYFVTFTATTYDATLIHTFGSGRVGGLAISNDGFLYISTASFNRVFRLPVNDVAALQNIATIGFPADGLAVTNDSSTVFVTSLSNGFFSFPTNQGFPAFVTNLTSLAIAEGIDIAIQPLPLIASPTNLTGQQFKNDFVLLYERFNRLQWDPSSSNDVAGYYVYRNGNVIATLGASTLSYDDHNIPKGVSTFYSVSAFDTSGNQSTLANVTIN